MRTVLKITGTIQDNGTIVGLRLVNLLFIPPNGESIAELQARQQGKSMKTPSFYAMLPLARAKSLLKTKGCSNATITDNGIVLKNGKLEDLPVYDKDNKLQSEPCLVHIASVYQDEQLAGYFFIDTDNEFIQVPVSDVDTVRDSVTLLGLLDKEELHYSSADKSGPARLAVTYSEGHVAPEKKDNVYRRHRVDKAQGIFEKGGKIVIAPKEAPLESNNIKASFDGLTTTDCTLNYKLVRILNFMKEHRPFYWGMLQSLTRIPDESIGTMAVTPKKFFYSPTFLAELRESNLVFVLIHEAMHIGMQHHARQGERQPYVWNVACDLFVNKCIVDEFQLKPGDYEYNPLKGKTGTVTGGNIGITLPSDCLFSTDIDIQRDTVEMIYDRLVSENPELDQQISMGLQGDSDKQQSSGAQGTQQDQKGNQNQNNQQQGQNTAQGAQGGAQGQGQSSNQGDGQQGASMQGPGGQQGGGSAGQSGNQSGNQSGGNNGGQQSGKGSGSGRQGKRIDITYNGKHITSMTVGGNESQGKGTNGEAKNVSGVNGDSGWQPDIVRTVDDFNNKVDEQAQATNSIMSAKKLVESCGKQWSKGLPDFMLDKLIDFVPVPAVPWTKYLRSTIMHTRLSPYETWSAVDGRGIASIRALAETAYTEETTTLLKQAEEAEMQRDALNIKLFKLCREKGIPTPKESLDACIQDAECYAMLTELQKQAELCKNLREKAEEQRQLEIEKGGFDTATLPISLPAKEQIEEPNAYLFAIDTSGSVDSVMLSKVMSQIAQIMTLNPKASIEIIYWGSQIVGYKAADNLNDFRTYVKSVGAVPDGGGTDVNSVFNLYMEGSRWLKTVEGMRLKKAHPQVYLDIQKHLNKQKRKLPILTIFTDGYFGAIEEKTLAKMRSKSDRVLWVIQDNPSFVNPLNGKSTNGVSKHSANIVHTEDKLKKK